MYELPRVALKPPPPAVFLTQHSHAVRLCWGIT